jgi:hypothetical protein
MDVNSRYFIALLTAFMKDTIPLKPNFAGDRTKQSRQQVDIDWQKIYELARKHSLAGAIYLAIQKLKEADKPEESIINKFKSDFFYATFRYEEQQKAYREITDRFNEQKIRHIYFKGILIREFYPVKQVRTQGDIDFLVYREDMEKVKKIFTDLSYRCSSSVWHDKYTKDKVVFEAHDKIVNTKINSKVDYAEYFKNPWEHAEPKGNSYTYELNMNYHLVYLLTHLAKHFYKTGAGVRMIFDIAIILDKFSEDLDFSRIWRELKIIKLDIFARNIFSLCEIWFDIKVPEMNFEIDETTFRAVSNYITDGGTFGFSYNNIAMAALRKEYSKTEKPKLIKSKAIFGKVFLDFDMMREKYPILKKHPYLLVFAWIHRGVKCIVKKRRRTFRILKGICKNTAEGHDSHVMMKKIGL